MDAVILAGGRNQRLGGVVPPYMKPLIVVNQRPLVAQAVEVAQQVIKNGGEGGSVIVVTSPESTLPISHVIDVAAVDMLVKTGGPGAALRSALDLVTMDYVLVLMADNLTPTEDVNKIVTKMGNVVGTGLVPLEDCERFTRLRGLTWVEKVPVTKEDEVFPGLARCWLGPLKLDARLAAKGLDVLAGERDTDDLPISPIFNMFDGFTTVDVHSVDIGLPEVLP